MPIPICFLLMMMLKLFTLSGLAIITRPRFKKNLIANLRNIIHPVIFIFSLINFGLTVGGPFFDFAAVERPKIAASLAANVQFYKIYLLTKQFHSFAGGVGLCDRQLPGWLSPSISAVQGHFKSTLYSRNLRIRFANKADLPAKDLSSEQSFYRIESPLIAWISFLSLHCPVYFVDLRWCRGKNWFPACKSPYHMKPNPEFNCTCLVKHKINISKMFPLEMYSRKNIFYFIVFEIQNGSWNWK